MIQAYRNVMLQGTAAGVMHPLSKRGQNAVHILGLSRETVPGGQAKSPLANR